MTFVAPIEVGTQTVASKCPDLLFTTSNLIHSSPSAQCYSRSLPHRRGSNSSRLISFHPSEQQLSQFWETTLQQTAGSHPGACLRLFVSAVCRSILTIPLLCRLRGVSWTTRFLNSNRHKRSATHAHTHSHTHTSSCSLCCRCGA